MGFFRRSPLVPERGERGGDEGDILGNLEGLQDQESHQQPGHNHMRPQAEPSSTSGVLSTEKGEGGHCNEPAPFKIKMELRESLS